MIWWLTPDLSERRLQSLTDLPVAAALDSFGQYLAIADGRVRAAGFTLERLYLADAEFLVGLEGPRPGA